MKCFGVAMSGCYITLEHSLNSSGYTDAFVTRIVKNVKSAWISMVCVCVEDGSFQWLLWLQSAAKLKAKPSGSTFCLSSVIHEDSFLNSPLF